MSNEDLNFVSDLPVTARMEALKRDSIYSKASDSSVSKISKIFQKSQFYVCELFELLNLMYLECFKH
jgi:predicted phosphohydrolase